MLGSAAGKHDLPQRPAARDAEGAPGVDQHRIDAAHAAIGVEQDRKQAGEEDDEDLHLVADAEEQDGDRDIGRGRDRPDELGDRLEQPVEQRHRPHQQPERHRHQHREAEAREDAPQARQHGVEQLPVAQRVEPRGDDDADARDRHRIDQPRARRRPPTSTSTSANSRNPGQRFLMPASLVPPRRRARLAFFLQEDRGEQAAGAAR